MKTTNTSSPLTASPLQSLELFKSLPYELVQMATQGALIFETRSREIVFAEGDLAAYFYIVVSGQYRIFQGKSGSQRIVHDIVTPDDVVGALLMCKEIAYYPVTLQSIGPSRLLRLSKTNYEAILEIPELSRRLQQAQLVRTERMRKLVATKFSPLEERVVFALQNLVGSPEQNEIKLNITRQDLADLIGASVESVIRLFSSWKSTGRIIKTDSGEFFLPRTGSNG